MICQHFLVLLPLFHVSICQPLRIEKTFMEKDSKQIRLSKPFPVFGGEKSNSLICLHKGGSITFGRCENNGPLAALLVYNGSIIHSDVKVLYGTGTGPELSSKDIYTSVNKVMNSVIQAKYAWVFATVWVMQRDVRKPDRSLIQLVLFGDRRYRTDGVGKEVFAIFNYKHLEDMALETWGTCGLQKATDESYYLPGSGTMDVLKLSKRSNCGMPGLWLYTISQPMDEIAGSQRRINFTSTMPALKATRGFDSDDEELDEDDDPAKVEWDVLINVFVSLVLLAAGLFIVFFSQGRHVDHKEEVYQNIEESVTEDASENVNVDTGAVGDFGDRDLGID